MSTRTNYFIQATLDHIYLNADIANIGDAAGLQNSAVAGNFYAALLVSGVECDYGSYTRIAIPRTGAGFSRVGNVISNVAQLNFPKATSGSNTANQVALYDLSTGGQQLHLQTLVAPITITTNVQPIIEAGSLTITGS